MTGRFEENSLIMATIGERFSSRAGQSGVGSQTCPYSDFVDPSNRNKDKFKCFNCGYEDLSDRVAATNYFRRFGDETIGLNMPHSQVKTILLERFHRRLETGQPVTVPGRSLETAEGISSQMPFEIRKLSQPGEMISQTGRSIRQRNTMNTF